MKLLIIRNKNSVIHLTFKENLYNIGKTLGIDIIEKNNVEVWKDLRSENLNKDIYKVWMVVKDYQLAKYMELNGYKVYNNSKAIEICDNKGLQYVYLKDFMPNTQLCPLIYNTKDISIEDFSEIKYPCILKEYYGSFGKGVYKINDREELQKKIQKLNTYLFLLQDFIDTSDNEYQAKSYRICIIGDKIVASMLNCNKIDYRTQTIHGGEHYKCDLPGEALEIVRKAKSIIGNDFAGVDIFKDNRTDKWYISEVNTSGGLEVLSKLHNREIVIDILNYIKYDD